MARKLQKRVGKKHRSKRITKLPTLKEITDVYEKMTIFVLRNSSYSVEYLKRMPIFDFLDLFDVCVEISKKTKE